MGFVEEARTSTKGEGSHGTAPTGLDLSQSRASPGSQYGGGVRKKPSGRKFPGQKIPCSKILQHH